MGNSGYGETITNHLKQRNVEYRTDAEASHKVNTPLFRILDNITEDTYEAEFCKQTIKLNLPIQVGFSVHQYAKLRMIQFYCISIAAIFKFVKWTLTPGIVWRV